MSDNRKEFEEWWNEVNPEPNRTKRVQYTDAYTCFIAGYKSAAEQSSKEIERLNKLVAMLAEALKSAKDWIDGEEYKKRFEEQIVFPALSASSSTVAKWEAEHAEKVLEENGNLFDSQYIAGAKFGWNCCAENNEQAFQKAINGRIDQRATKVKE